MTKGKIITVTGTLISDDEMLSFAELCHAVHTDPELIIQLVEYRVIHPVGKSQADWQFDCVCLKRAKIARNFYHDLEVNLPGIALVIEMMEEIAELESQFARLK